MGCIREGWGSFHLHHAKSRTKVMMIHPLCTKTNSGTLATKFQHFTFASARYIRVSPSCNMYVEVLYHQRQPYDFEFSSAIPRNPLTGQIEYLTLSQPQARGNWSGLTRILVVHAKPQAKSLELLDKRVQCMPSDASRMQLTHFVSVDTSVFLSRVYLLVFCRTF